MKITSIFALALCVTICLPGFAAKKKKEIVVHNDSGEMHLRIDNGGYQHEVMINGATQSFPLSSGTSGGNLAFGSGLTVINFSAGYNYDLPSFPMLQIGAFPSISYISSVGSATMFSFLVGPTFNVSLNGNIEDAFFGTAAMGISSIPGSTGFSFRFDAGKRFRIFDHLSYQPSFGVVKISGMSAMFVFNLLGGSVHF